MADTVEPQVMDAPEQIRKFAEFLERSYYAQLVEQARKGEKFIIVDFQELAKFEPALADLLLEMPEEAFKASQLAVEQFDLPGGNNKGFTVRFKNLPPSSQIMIRNIRSPHLGKLLFTEGTVRNKSEVRPHVTSARFECPSCGNILQVLQLDNKFKEPTRCSCGRKGKFKMLSKELVDAQGLVLEEASEQLEGGEQPKRLNVFLKNDLVSPMSERRTNPGSKVLIVGVLKEVPITLRSGGQSVKFDLIFEVNSLEPREEDFSDIKISPSELEEIKQLAADPQLERKIIQSLAPSIYGHDKIKEALVLQLMGGVRKQRDDGVTTRGDIHVLLIGDPGSGKSQLLKRIGKISPKGRFISGKGVSGAGLTASVIKDDFIGGWSLEAGALVLANKGICCIDEMDKMDKDDTAAMHEALEGQTITISKANIQATLHAQTTVLAAANPKFGRFDPFDTIAKQIDMPPTLINRFDLIFPIKDLPDANKDEKMAKFVLMLHKDLITESEIKTPLLRKYIAYARQNVFPKLTEGAIEELKDYYIQMRSSGSKEGVIKSVPISARQLEALVRLAEAHARLHLSDKVTKKNAKKAVELLHHCLSLVAMDEETGTFDIDRIATDTPASARNKMIIIKELLTELEKVAKPVDMRDLMRHAGEKNISDGDVEEIIQKLKRGGDIFEPKPGFIQRL
ncbi:MAG TPA: minichromosome maintenance protein MCM [Candidatus Binatia bacterium]|nr:minichromosome maintenance protein MCM [Candidatus Binatia bacterium]